MNPLIVVILSCQLLYYNSSNEVSCYNVIVGVKGVTQSQNFINTSEVIFDGNFKYIPLGTNEEMCDVYSLYIYRKGIAPYGTVTEEVKQKITEIYNNIAGVLGAVDTPVNIYEIIGYGVERRDIK